MEKTKTSKRARSRPLPPDVNSRNLAIEKRRRLDMNEKFLDLARCVPALASATKNLSKPQIVDESIKHLRRQRNVCVAAGQDVENLLSTHNELIAEVNTLRSQLGVPLESPLRPPSTALLLLMDMKNTVYGDFPDGLRSPGKGYASVSPSSTIRGDLDSPSEALSSVLEPDVQEQAFVEDSLPSLFDETYSTALLEAWQTQTPNLFSYSSDSQNLPYPDPGSDFPEMNVLGLDADALCNDWQGHMTQWEDPVLNQLQASMRPLSYEMNPCPN